MSRFKQNLARRALFGMTALCLLAIACNHLVAENGVDPRIAPEGITLKQGLEKGLKARRPSEFDFIALVVRKVEQGKLPRKLVERTFLWARDNKQPYPMPYFEKALQIQAKKLGVNLPFTDT